MIIPVHTPALKIPPIAAQLLKRKTKESSKKDKDVFFMIVIFINNK